MTTGRRRTLGPRGARPGQSDAGNGIVDHSSSQHILPANAALKLDPESGLSVGSAEPTGPGAPVRVLCRMVDFRCINHALACRERLAKNGSQSKSKYRAGDETYVDVRTNAEEFAFFPSTLPKRGRMWKKPWEAFGGCYRQRCQGHWWMSTLNFPAFADQRQGRARRRSERFSPAFCLAFDLDALPQVLCSHLF